LHTASGMRTTRAVRTWVLLSGVPSLLAIVGCSSDATNRASPVTPPSDDAHDAGIDSAPSSPASDAAPTATPLQARFRTIDTTQYLTQSSGGALAATASTAGTTETFTLIDVNGGALESGDAVLLASASGAYLSAAGGGGGALTFTASSAGDNETFYLDIVEAAAKVVGAGVNVSLRTKGTGNYLSAIKGGGGEVLANAPWAHAWETFTFDVVDTSGPPPIDPPTTPATAAKKRVLDFLASISGNKTAIGVEDKSGGIADSNKMSSMAGNGEYPSFWSADFGFGGAA